MCYKSSFLLLQKLCREVKKGLTLTARTSATQQASESVREGHGLVQAADAHLMEQGFGEAQAGQLPLCRQRQGLGR